MTFGHGLLLFFMAVLAFRALFGLLPAMRYRQPSPPPLPRTFNGWLSSPVPLVAKDVPLMPNGQCADVYNRAGALALLRDRCPLT